MKRNLFNELKEGIEFLASKAKDLELYDEASLNSKYPICTKCRRNLFFYDGWQCMCEEQDVDKDCWINFQTVDDTIKALKEENQILRKIISRSAKNLGNGSVISEDASTQFMEELPKEIYMVINRWIQKANNTKIIENMLDEIKRMLI
jgi:hypothetical protein